VSTLSLFDAPEPPRSAPELSLRPYQGEARLAVSERLLEAPSTLVVLPVGTGKSRLGGSIVWDFKLASQRALILCPTIVLVRQMYRDLRALGLRATIEQADNRADRTADVVVASVATMRGDRLKSWPKTTFGVVVVDECHRSVSPLYGDILNHFATAKRVGLTATPQRADGLSLANVYETVAYSMSMLTAIRDGWLVPLKFKTAITDFDAKKLRTLAGEIDASSVAAEITRCGLLHEAANTLAELAGDERTVAFLPTVAASRAFVGELTARGMAAEHIDAGTPEESRNEVFRAFAAGEVRVLSNVGILTEGWDLPACSVCALLNPTKSWSRITQMIGRVTRLSPGKTHALVIDFCPGRLKKGRLASPADALAGKMLPDNVHDVLAEEGDLAEAIERAEQKAEDIEKKKRAKAEAAERRRQRARELALLSQKKAFSYGVQEHDANEVFGAVGSGPRPYAMNDVDGPDEETMRRQAGLCTPKQAKVLKSKGLNPWMSKKLAHEAMDAIANNGWRVPDHIRKDPRFYAKKDAPERTAEMAEELLQQLKAAR
jgi:superfamily II DNA or RNA helicase